MALKRENRIELRLSADFKGGKISSVACLNGEARLVMICSYATAVLSLAAIPETAVQTLLKIIAEMREIVRNILEGKQFIAQDTCYDVSALGVDTVVILG